jgi:hypothetical protein
MRYFTEDTRVVSEVGICSTYLVTEIEERSDMFAERRYRITATKPGNAGHAGHFVFLNLATREQANTFQIGDALDLVRRPRS